jgi:hypothetical protein
MQIYRELHHADDVTPLALEALTLELLIGIVRSAQPSPNEPLAS